MKVKQLCFQTNKVTIEVSAQLTCKDESYKYMKFATIIPTIDGQFMIKSDHIEQPLFNYYKSLDKAKEGCQQYFQEWVLSFFHI